jgi:hypothetical protein
MAKFKAERTRQIKAMLGIGSMPSARTAIYLALYTSDPTINNTGTEVSGGSYARKAITVDTDSDGDGSVKNTAAITFNSMPAVTVTHFAVFDALTGGNPIMYDTFPIPAQMSAGENFTIDIGNLILSEL